MASYPLHAACRDDKAAEVAVLLDDGADVDWRIGDDYPDSIYHSATPLTLAAGFDRMQVVYCLLKHNADVNLAAKDGCTPLYIAARHDSLQVVRCLVKNDADVNLANEGCVSMRLFADGDGKQKRSAWPRIRSFYDGMSTSHCLGCRSIVISTALGRA